MSQAQINAKANKKIKQLFQSLGIYKCELNFEGCLVNWTLAPAHKEKRIWYKENGFEWLSDRSHILLACQHCHSILDDRSKTTKKQSDSYYE